MTGKDTLLDDFCDLAPWQAIAPGAARLQLRHARDGDGCIMHLDYDLAGGGFVIARRALALTLPEDYAFTLERRGHGGQHIVEFKLVDDSLANVWRLRDEHFELGVAWTPWHIAARDIIYAWGARRTRRLAHCDALEIAVVGSGRGTLSLRNLRLCDLTYDATPRVHASSAEAAHPAIDVLVDDPRHWQSAAAGEQSLCLDFGGERAFSAVHIDWRRDALPVAHAIDVRDADGAWQCRHRSEQRPGPRSTVLLPDTRSTGLRLRVDGGAARAAVRHIAFAPWYYAPNLYDGLASMALEAAPGVYPKALREQQSYWTVTGAAGGSGVALINTEGLVEVDGGDFAVEPFVAAGTTLFTWADVELEASLEDDCLPLPRVRWRGPGFTLDIAPVMLGSGEDSALHVRYRLSHHGSAAETFALQLVVRPFLVTPIWQQWQGHGGITSLHHLAADRDGLTVNHARRLAVTPAADAVVAEHGAGESLLEALRGAQGFAACEVRDDAGLASAGLVFSRTLAAGQSIDIHARVAAAGGNPSCTDAALAHAHAADEWRSRLGVAPLRLPAAQRAPVLTLLTAAAHILVNRRDARLQPGPRRYTRAYLRDAVGMGTALARLGMVEPLKRLLDWYGPFQRDDGELPDCVDDDGAEWLPEYDAYGQYLHGVAEALRLAPDPAFLARQWPRAQRVLARLESLRARRLDEQYRDTACFGLLPESMSHEGYMAQPVHAYWDDFWALRGLRDVAWLAAQAGDEHEARRITALAVEFRTDLHASLARSMATHGIDFIPGSVELGDFDATAIAIALTVADDGDGLPRAALDATFDRYLAIRAERSDSTRWSNYSAYEIRIVGALLRLGRRDDALAVLHALLADCRPAAWRQWPEQSWRDYDAPAFLGDLPHSWIGAEYIHALTSAFAYEHHDDASLVLAAGVDGAWLHDEGVTVTALATHHGPLSYRLRRLDAQRVEMHVDAGITLPAGGLVLRPPLPAPLRALTVNGIARHDFDQASWRCHALPAHIVFVCGDQP
ncbi:MAG: hypothetical protein IPM80_13055 [Proteobacteria bacterium]|nr:hypothetical protein [Pseudomonadota bacterium]